MTYPALQASVASQRKVPLSGSEVAATIEAMVTTSVTLLTGSGTLSVLSTPPGAVAKINGNDIELTLPYKLSGTTQAVNYRITTNTNTNSNSNSNSSSNTTVQTKTLLVSVPDAVLAKPTLFLSEIDTAEEIDAALIGGWGTNSLTAGYQSYRWYENFAGGGLTWMDAVAENGGSLHLPFIAHEQSGTLTPRDMFLLPPGQPSSGVGWTAAGQDAFNRLRNDLRFLDAVKVITIEFHHGPADLNGDLNTETWVRDTIDFFIAEFNRDLPDLASRIYVTRSRQLSGIVPLPASTTLHSRYARAFRPLTNTGNVSNNISVLHNLDYSPLRGMHQDKANTGVTHIGAYMQGPVSHRITPRTGWPNSFHAVKPSYGHYLSSLYQLERIGVTDWITFHPMKNNGVHDFASEEFTSLTAAASDWSEDTIRSNDQFGASNSHVGVFS